MNTNLIVTLAVIVITALPGRSQDQTIAGNLTVTQSLLVQQDTNLYGATTFGRLAENPQMEGLRVAVQQDSWTSTYTNVITPGYGIYHDVIVEDYGWIDAGYWSPVYGWVTVNDYIPATYDADANILTPESWSSHQEWQQVSSTWFSNLIWGVTGTHTQQVQDYWVPEQVETVELTNFGAPRILLGATRSDTNWVFQAPSTSNGQMRDVLTIYNGGMNMSSEDGLNSISLSPWQVAQYAHNPSSNTTYNAQRQADVTVHTSNASWQSPSGLMHAETTNTSRPESIVLSRTEFGASGTGNSTQTQIAAKSAQFGGVVTVEGDLKVKGSLRVLPAGDLSMGSFHTGIRPDGTVDPGS
jgi:hypothetical protein